MKNREIALVSLFAALTAVGAWLSLPLGPVPFTLQLLFVLLSGAVLGSYLGALSQVVYLLLGIVGLPVFAGGTSGLGHLFGPTGGYLIGFVAASFVVGIFSQRGGFWAYFVSMFFGILIIHLLGVAQLSLVAKLSFKKALFVGSLPFLPFDLVKAFIAASLAISLKRANFTFNRKG